MTAARLIEIPCKHIASILEVHCKLEVLVKYNWFQTSVHYVEKQQAKFGVVNEVRIRQLDKNFFELAAKASAVRWLGHLLRKEVKIS